MAQRAQLEANASEIERMKLLILKLKRMQFGRKSEKIERRIEQLELCLEDLEASQASSAPEPGSPLEAVLEQVVKRKPGAARVARRITSRNDYAKPERNELSRLRRRVAEVRRRRLGNIGVRAGAIQSHSTRAAEASSSSRRKGLRFATARQLTVAHKVLT